MTPSPDARTSPRARSRIDPSARTTVMAATHGRVTPYLNVAGPASLRNDRTTWGSRSMGGIAGCWGARAVARWGGRDNGVESPAAPDYTGGGRMSGSALLRAPASG